MSKSNLLEPDAKPTLTPATGAAIGTPASNILSVAPQHDAIEELPFELVTSHVSRIEYGKSSGFGITGKTALSAKFP